MFELTKFEMVPKKKAGEGGVCGLTYHRIRQVGGRVSTLNALNILFRFLQANKQININIASIRVRLTLSLVLLYAGAHLIILSYALKDGNSCNSCHAAQLPSNNSTKQKIPLA